MKWFFRIFFRHLGLFSILFCVPVHCKFLSCRFKPLACGLSSQDWAKQFATYSNLTERGRGPPSHIPHFSFFAAASCRERCGDPNKLCFFQYKIVLLTLESRRSTFLTPFQFSMLAAHLFLVNRCLQLMTYFSDDLRRKISIFPWKNMLLPYDALPYESRRGNFWLQSIVKAVHLPRLASNQV